MVSKVKTNKAARALSFTKILAGIATHVTSAIVLGGQSVTLQALDAVFQAAMQAQTDLDAARAAVSVKLAAHKAALAAAHAMAALLHKWAEATFGPASPILEDFGFTPAADRPVAVKAKAAAKSTATRRAKKAAVEAVVAPVAEPPALAPAPAPAGGTTGKS